MLELGRWMEDVEVLGFGGFSDVAKLIGTLPDECGAWVTPCTLGPECSVLFRL